MKADPSVQPVSFSLAEWQSFLTERGHKPFRARQIYRWIHARGIFDPALMTDLSLDLRRDLGELGLGEPGEVAAVHEAADGTRKILLNLRDGARLECVLIPMTPGGADDDDEAEPLGQRARVTLCVSTQFGCAMGCTFCASGQAGLIRGLKASEILAQVYVARRYLKENEDLRNLVFMGMGEPLHHYEETKRALDILTDPEGASISPRRITVSTVGLIPGIRRLGEDYSGKIGLALSLHAADDETRSRIMPMNKRYPIGPLMQALREYPLPQRRRITIEYTLIQGVNDGLDHAERLAKVLRGVPVKVNLIPMNTIERSELAGTEAEGVGRFRDRLQARGLSCFVRTRRGDEVSAACGQLALQGIAPDKLVRRLSV